MSTTPSPQLAPIQSPKTRRLGPVIGLFTLAPLIGEVVFGATPLTHLPYLFSLAGLYGGGAVLIRELVRRRGLPSYWLAILGLAYGILEEGLVTQSIFNPHFHGLDFLGLYGHELGVSWVWAVFIVTYHAVFSISIPVLLAEAIHATRRTEPWLTRRSGAVVAGLFVLDCLWLVFGFIGVLEPGYVNPAPAVLLVAALVVAGLVAAAFHARPQAAAVVPATKPAPTPRRLRILSFAAALGWIGVRMFLTDPGYPVWIPLAGDAAVVTAVVLSARRLLRRTWTLEHYYALAAGPLPISWLFGFLIVAVSSTVPVIDLPGHLLVGIVMFIALRRLHQRIRRASHLVSASHCV